MKNMKLVLPVIAAIAATGLTTAIVQTDAATQPSPMREKAEKTQPFKGKVEAVDAKAKTLTVAGTTLQVSDTTTLTKDGKPITLADIKVGEHVHGKSRPAANGKTEAVNIEVGEEEAATEPE